MMQSICMTMRVLHVSGDTGTGGVETFLETLARWQHLDPTAVHEFAFSADGPLSTRLEGIGQRPYLLPAFTLHRPANLLRARHAFAQLLRSQRYDIVLFHQYLYLIVA